MEELISVIIPIYNVEKYLVRCVDSVLHATHRALDVILVDDGSTDRSGEIADGFVASDRRVRVFHKENGGLSSARNFGIEQARGEYLAFVDSDDYVNEDGFSVLFRALTEENADLAVGALDYRNEEGEYLHPCLPIERRVYGEGEALHCLSYDDPARFIVVWNKLYRASLFRDVRFPIGKYAEDNYIAHLILERAQKVVTVPDTVYHYTVRESSITNSKTAQMFYDDVVAFRERIEYLKCKNDDALVSGSVRSLFSTAQYYVGEKLLARSAAPLSADGMEIVRSAEKLTKEALLGIPQPPFSRRERKKIRRYLSSGLLARFAFRHANSRLVKKCYKSYIEYGCLRAVGRMFGIGK